MYINGVSPTKIDKKYCSRYSSFKSFGLGFSVCASQTCDIICCCDSLFAFSALPCNTWREWERADVVFGRNGIRY